ncbi:ATP-binding protein [Listeria monocytogenes]|uniref:AAA family ATPase n=2 Tax=Listeria TaxID=1637 RepID=A0A841Z428_9LIST|nr:MULTISPECIES: AAA family ATPase [Listeria]EAD6209099.1 ATP-binding protein [Listeria monocytogenes]EAD6219943.1 ATP-binding protein [Listeria monocytogenes]EAE3093961.1 ATP-binding protein [Listeria monocytogenes]EAE3142995.1 ATP-binding protein [Listeria monocytogenes]EAE3344659.1 ATP-binding protein [Listeria monocytogenes]
MNREQQYIETKAYKQFEEFCDACKKYKYIGICHGLPGVGKTQAARHYADWDRLYPAFCEFDRKYEVTDELTAELAKEKHTIFITAPTLGVNQITKDIKKIGYRITYMAREAFYEWDDGVDLIIIDEVDRLKMAHLEQIRDLYDRQNVPLILIGMPGIEKRLSRYPQLYSRIGFAHEYKKMDKIEAEHILHYKWEELGLGLQLADFSNYEAMNLILKITNGNFRLIHRLFTQIERVMEINQLQEISVDVVETARDSLVIG